MIIDIIHLNDFLLLLLAEFILRVPIERPKTSGVYESTMGGCTPIWLHGALLIVGQEQFRWPVLLNGDAAELKTPPVHARAAIHSIF